MTTSAESKSLTRVTASPGFWRKRLATLPPLRAKSRRLAALTGSLLLAGICSSAGNLTLGPVVSDYVANFSDLAFDNLSSFDSFSYPAVPAQPAGSIAYTAGFYPNSTMISFVTTGGLTVTYPPPAPGQLSYPLTIQTNGSPGSVSFIDHIAGSPPFTLAEPFYLGETGGIPTLTFLSTDADFRSEVHPFTISVTLPGNWSASGTTSGTHKLLADNQYFTVTSDFVFNPATDTTIVTATDPYYTGQSGPENLEFELFGSNVVSTIPSSVPEAPSIPILAAAFGLIGSIFLQRRLGAPNLACRKRD